MNICSKLLMSDSNAYLRYYRVLPPSEGEEPLGSLNESGQVQSFEVDIPQYFRPQLSTVLTRWRLTLEKACQRSLREDFYP
jgi:hypothetical protein